MRGILCQDVTSLQKFAQSIFPFSEIMHTATTWFAAKSMDFPAQNERSSCIAAYLSKGGKINYSSIQI